MKKDALQFRKDLLEWYDKHGRNLPWRIKGKDTQTAYNVWLSEIMLQQTTVQAVIPYYLKFKDLWPSIDRLAAAEQSDITDAWAGLGYYSRARNLHKCAQSVSGDHNGVFPQTEKDLLNLPGIGPYTASAIQAIAFNKPANVVDGNVERIMARLYAIQTPFPDGKVKAKEKASLFVGEYEGRHSDYAQALMDLGATICRPKSPLCHSCPVSKFCDGFKKQIANDLPKRIKKIPVPHKYGSVAIIMSADNKILIERRPQTGMLAGMIGLPTSEWLEEDSMKEMLLEKFSGDSADLNEVRHVFTHFSLTLKPILLKLKATSSDATINDKRNFFWKNIDDINPSEFPTIFKKVIKLLA